MTLGVSLGGVHAALLYRLLCNPCTAVLLLPPLLLLLPGPCVRGR